MKAYKILFGLLLMGFAAHAQITQKIATPTEFTTKLKVPKQLVIPTDTLSTADSGSVAMKNGNFYTKNGYWHLVTGYGGGGGTFSGTDSNAYYGFTGINDSSLVFMRKNGTRDTLVFRISGGSSGGSSSTGSDTLTVLHVGPIYTIYASADHKSVYDKGFSSSDVYTTSDSLLHIKNKPHGTMGYLLYYAPDGTPYTVNNAFYDSTNGAIEFTGFTNFDKAINIASAVSANGDISSLTSLTTLGQVRGQAFAISTYPITANHTIGTIEGNSVASGVGPYIVTLPSSGGTAAGRAYTISNFSSFPLTVNTTGSQNIYSGFGTATSFTIAIGAIATFQMSQMPLFPMYVVTNYSAVASGTYTPTAVSRANAAGTITPRLCHWHRDGDQVTVIGVISMASFTTANALTTIGISLPLASGITSVYDVAGLGHAVSTVSNLQYSTWFFGDVTNTMCSASFYPGVTTAMDEYFSFTYSLK